MLSRLGMVPSGDRLSKGTTFRGCRRGRRRAGRGTDVRDRRAGARRTRHPISAAISTFGSPCEAVHRTSPSPYGLGAAAAATRRAGHAATGVTCSHGGLGHGGLPTRGVGRPALAAGRIPSMPESDRAPRSGPYDGAVLVKWIRCTVVDRRGSSGGSGSGRGCWVSRDSGGRAVAGAGGGRMWRTSSRSGRAGRSTTPSWRGRTIGWRPRSRARTRTPRSGSSTTASM